MQGKRFEAARCADAFEGGKPLDRDTALRRLRTHIQTVAGRYKGWTTPFGKKILSGRATFGQMEKHTLEEQNEFQKTMSSTITCTLRCLLIG